METPFDVDINWDEADSHSNDDCELHNDYDNQKLFDIYESYLNKSDTSDTDSEPELSFNDQFLLTNKSSKTPNSNRRLSCLADIESRLSKTPFKTPKKRLSVNESSDSIEESMSELSLPFDINKMSDQEMIELNNNLEEEIFTLESDCPKMAANHMKDTFDKIIDLFNKTSEESENKFRNCLQKISVESKEDKRLDYNQMIGKQLSLIESNSEELKNLVFQLNVIKEISKK